ncbi:unnamed protein product [Pipistrellus nathusii]|uniref:Uncharacterized protein n=1 Tax=Pipistrellus nathusii TaxID=59473 RepID=A0ABN9Z969_PIPNA
MKALSKYKALTHLFYLDAANKRVGAMKLMGEQPLGSHAIYIFDVFLGEVWLSETPILHPGCWQFLLWKLSRVEVAQPGERRRGTSVAFSLQSPPSISLERFYISFYF